MFPMLTSDSLRHWQTWEAEYEGFKEELLALGDDCTDAELSYTGAQYEGTLLNEKEIEQLLEHKGQPRSRSQVVGLLDRRIDYVQKNINTIGAALRNAEKAAASLVFGQPDIQNEDGLPLAEIREELDEEGNVISSSITNPNDSTPHVVDALRKAGVNGLPEIRFAGDDQGNISEKKTAVRQATKNGETNPKATTSKQSKINQLRSTGGHQNVDSPSMDKPTIQGKKSVSFAAGTKKEDATTSKRRSLPIRPRQNGPGPRSSNSGGISPQLAPHTSSSIAKRADKMGANVSPAKITGLEAGENLEAPKAEPFSAIVPMNESSRDAELRRQMIEYNMRDVGSVVAEIDLEEEDDDDDNYGEEEDSQHSSSTDEEEDEFGRSKRSVLSNKYLKEMRALEKKMRPMMMQTTGPEAAVSRSAKVDLKSERVDKNEQNNNGHQDAKISPVKEVRFASKLDMQDSSSAGASYILGNHSGKSGTRPFQSPINERPSSGEPLTPPPSTKVSRFKNGRNESSTGNSKLTNRPAATSSDTGSKTSVSPTGGERNLRKPVSTPAVASIPLSSPQPPAGPHAATVIERPYSTSTAAPTEPDDLDPSLLRQQVATEYHNVRNRMIQRQGGFLASAAEEANNGHVALDEEGGERKISRFKAAKLRMGRGSG